MKICKGAQQMSVSSKVVDSKIKPISGSKGGDRSMKS